LIDEMGGSPSFPRSKDAPGTVDPARNDAPNSRSKFPRTQTRVANNARAVCRPDTGPAQSPEALRSIELNACARPNDEDERRRRTKAGVPHARRRLIWDAGGGSSKGRVVVSAYDQGGRASTTPERPTQVRVALRGCGPGRRASATPSRPLQQDGADSPHTRVMGARQDGAGTAADEGRLFRQVSRSNPSSPQSRRRWRECVLCKELTSKTSLLDTTALLFGPKSQVFPAGRPQIAPESLRQLERTIGDLLLANQSRAIEPCVCDDCWQNRICSLSRLQPESCATEHKKSCDTQARVVRLHM